jgi:hypothetical protein
MCCSSLVGDERSAADLRECREIDRHDVVESGTAAVE